MADMDWSSLTGALIPASVGLAFGGRNRGTAAALGAAEGIGAAESNRIEVEKTNAALRQRQQALDLDQKQLEEQKSRNVFLNRHIEDQMKTSEQARQQQAALHNQIMVDRAAEDEFAKTLSPEELVQFRANKKSYLDNRLYQFTEGQKLDDSAKIAESIPGLVPQGMRGKDYLKTIDKKVFEQLVQNEQKHKGEMAEIGGRTAGALQLEAARHRNNLAELSKNPWSMVPLTDGSGFLTHNRSTNERKVVTMEELGGNKIVTDATKLKAADEMRKIWATEMKDNPAGVTPLAEWERRPENVVMGKVLRGDLTPDQKQAALDGIQQQKINNYNAAMQNARAAWAKGNGRDPKTLTAQDDALFEKRLGTAEGAAAFKKWLDFETAAPGKYIDAEKKKEGPATPTRTAAEQAAIDAAKKRMGITK
jgi:hypothetical protein